MLVLSLHSKSRVERALLGSTAERVVRSAHIPVLSIPITTLERLGLGAKHRQSVACRSHGLLGVLGAGFGAGEAGIG